MSNLITAPRTDATRIYALRDEIYAPDMLIAAVCGLDFFTWLDTHPSTLDEITAHYGFHRRPADVMTTLFVAMGLVARDGDRLRVTDLAREHLVAGSPWYAAPYFPRVEDRPIARDLIEILRTGQPARFAGRKDEDDWHHAMEAEAFAEEFLAAMDCRGRVTGQALAAALDPAGRRLLDVGGGSGIFACALAAARPELECAVLEKPPVDRVAARAISQRGLDGRVNVIAADMIEDAWPVGYDIHLLSNVLHDWDEPIVRHLLTASARSIVPGGTVVVHETFLDADKCGPLSVAAYSVLLMHVTQGRCYSTAEIGGWLEDAGFRVTHHVPTALGRSAIVAVKA